MAKFDVLDTGGSQLRVGYNGSNYVEVSVDSGGDATVTPSGGDLTLAGTLKVTGASMTYDGVANARGTFTTAINVTVSGLTTLTGSSWRYAVAEFTCVGGAADATGPFVSKYLVRLKGLSSWTMDTATNIGGGTLTIAAVSGTTTSATFSVTAATSTVCSIAVTAHGQTNSPAISFS